MPNYSVHRFLALAVLLIIVCLEGVTSFSSVDARTSRITPYAAKAPSDAATRMPSSLSPTSATIWGAAALSIPVKGSVRHPFTARFWNGSTEVLGRQNILWSLRTPKTGVTIQPRSGALTITSRAAPGTCTLVAVSGPLTATRTVQIDHFRMTYFLSTDDTGLTLAVKDNQLAILSLANPAANWNWVNGNAVVPFVQLASAPAPDWTFQDVTADYQSGTKLTLRFTSTTPRLELSSV